MAVDMKKLAAEVRAAIVVVRARPAQYAAQLGRRVLNYNAENHYINPAVKPPVPLVTKEGPAAVRHSQFSIYQYCDRCDGVFK